MKRLEELVELAHNLDWGNPYEDPDDIKDSLRNNWENPLDDDDVDTVYEIMCEIWDDKN